MAMDEMPDGCDSGGFTLKCRADERGGYRWQREDGEWVSPVFKTLNAAANYALNCPLLTEEEWLKAGFVDHVVPSVEIVDSLGD